MPESEFRAVSSEEFMQELEDAVRRMKENKYASQVGLKDLDFDVDEKKAEKLGVTLPFQSIDQAEDALRQKVITPTVFFENDDTEHQMTFFDPEPVGFSGFMDCATHSLALTDQGLFEVGRYPAISLQAAFEGPAQSKYWQWFLHRRLATPEQVAAWQEDNDLTDQQVVDLFYEAMTGRERTPTVEPDLESAPPDLNTLMAWEAEGGCEATDGCWVEPDGTCPHGHPSWLLKLGLI